jgi:hypothetical protein
MAAASCGWCLETKAGMAVHACGHAVCAACRDTAPSGRKKCLCCRFDKPGRAVFVSAGARYGAAVKLLAKAGAAPGAGSVLCTPVLSAAVLATLEKHAAERDLVFVRGVGCEKEKIQLAPAGDPDAVFLCKWGDDLEYHVPRRGPAQLIDEQQRAALDALAKVQAKVQGAPYLQWMHIKLGRPSPDGPLVATAVSDWVVEKKLPLNYGAYFGFSEDGKLQMRRCRLSKKFVTLLQALLNTAAAGLRRLAHDANVLPGEEMFFRESDMFIAMMLAWAQARACTPTPLFTEKTPLSVLCVVVPAGP